MSCPLTIAQLEDLINKGHKVDLRPDGGVGVYARGQWTSAADLRRIDELAVECSRLTDKIVELQKPPPERSADPFEEAKRRYHVLADAMKELDDLLGGEDSLDYTHLADIVAKAIKEST